MKNYIIILVFLFLLASCDRVTSTNEQLVLTSSTYFLSVAEALASGFRAETKQLINVKGSLGGEADLLRQNLTNLIIVSENPSPSEFDHKLLAYDKTIVIVNKNNSINSLTQSQLRAIFNGEINNWSQVGGSNRPIQVITREVASSIRVYFEKQILNSGSELSLSSLVFNSNPDMKSAISNIPNSIGYISAGALSEKVKEIEILNNQKQKLNLPLLGVYAVWRKNDDNVQVKEFLQFLDSSNLAKEIIQDAGFILAEDTAISEVNRKSDQSSTGH